MQNYTKNEAINELCELEMNLIKKADKLLMAERASKNGLWDHWAEAYNAVVKFDGIDWHDLDTIDIVLEYIPGVTI